MERERERERKCVCPYADGSSQENRISTSKVAKRQKVDCSDGPILACIRQMKWQNYGTVFCTTHTFSITCSVRRPKVLFVRGLFVEGCDAAREISEVQTVLICLACFVYLINTCDM